MWEAPSSACYLFRRLPQEQQNCVAAFGKVFNVYTLDCACRSFIGQVGDCEVRCQTSWEARLCFVKVDSQPNKLRAGFCQSPWRKYRPPGRHAVRAFSCVCLMLPRRAQRSPGRSDVGKKEKRKQERKEQTNKTRRIAHTKNKQANSPGANELVAAICTILFLCCCFDLIEVRQRPATERFSGTINSTSASTGKLFCDEQRVRHNMRHYHTCFGIRSLLTYNKSRQDRALSAENRNRPTLQRSLPHYDRLRTRTITCRQFYVQSCTSRTLTTPQLVHRVSIIGAA